MLCFTARLARQDHARPASSRGEMGVSIRVTSGPAIEKPKDLAALPYQPE